MQKQKFDEIVSYFNKKVSEMEIETKYKMELLGMVTALEHAHEKERTETHGVCLDVIDRQAAQTELMMKCERYTLAKESHGMGHVEWSSDLISVADAMNAIRWLPPAQTERKKGHWVEIGDEPYDEWECDMCGFVIDGSGCIDPEEYRDVYKFCPNCGADMRKEDA